MRAGVGRAKTKAVKLDLHRHLEGSHSAQALASVAQRFGLDHPLFARDEASLARELTVPGPSDDALLFYRCIQKARVAYVSEAAIRELALLAFQEAAEDTDGFEMRVSLFSMTRTLLENEGKNWRETAPDVFAARCDSVLRAILSARDEASRTSGKPMLVRLAFSRTFESDPHYRALGEMAPAHKSALCGLDILGIVTGAEKEPLPPALVDIVSRVRRDIPDLTVHAGEFESHASVARTLELDPEAIGHGVHSVQSDETMAALQKRGTTLEVCPTSNALLIPSALGALVRQRGAAPLAVLQQHGVHCVLGSDDPTPFGTTFSREWDAVKTLGADPQQLARDIERRWRQLTRATS